MGYYDDSGTDSSSPASSSSSSSTPKKGRDWKGGVRAAGESLMDSGRDEMDRASSDSIRPVTYHRGGKVRKTGRAVLQKGERVISRSKTPKVERMMKRAKMRMKSRG
jgi:hypothetical protein